jgi:CubicO group peptidase (beta-lactamase class C family)
MSQLLQEILDDVAARTGCPGAAVGVWLEGEQHVAVTGVTSVDNPVEVDPDTIFQIGSSTKTFTATLAMQLVAAGRLSLEARVRDYLPDFRVRDDPAADEVAVRHLTNHTAGWAGDYLGQAGDHGGGAVRRYIEQMADLPQEFAVGTATSYNNASFVLLGRIIEVITGQVYDVALRELLLEPLGMAHSFTLPSEVMTYRFAVGHHRSEDGYEVSRPWPIPRGSGPAGGIAASVRDQLRWLDFHLGKGSSDVLSVDRRLEMREPTAAMPAGNAGADHVGTAWMLKDLPGGLRKVGHGGATIGQVSALEMVPGRGIGVTVLSNASCELSRVVARRVLDELGGVTWPDPEPSHRPRKELLQYVGRYDGSGYTLDVSLGEHGLQVRQVMQPQVLAQLGISTPPPSPPPMPAAMVGSTGDVFVLTGGGAQGATGGFVRDPSGRIVHMNLGGRLAFPAAKEA